MLINILAIVRDSNVSDVALSIVYWVVVRIYETTIRLNVKRLITCDNLSVELRIYLNCIVLYKRLTSLIVTL